MKTVLLICLPAAVILSFMSASADVTHDASWSVMQCLECHPRAHPTHRPMVPKTMRKDLPLDRTGRMQCITCHQCIAGTCTIPKDKARLCRVCHDCTQGMSCVLQTAHIGDSGDIRYLSAQRCLECHGKALNRKVCDLGGRTLDILFFQSDENSLKYSPRKGVVLVDGRVACISCHDPYSTLRGRLFMSNRESGVCLSCHNKLENVNHSGYAGNENACIGCHPRVWPTHRKARVNSPKTGLPLDARGGMLCMTCHDCVSGTCLLRLNKPELCASCHDCTQGMACMLGAAHLGESRKAITGSSCLQCHDDALVRSCGLSKRTGAPGGRVECTTCHDPYSGKHAKLPQGANAIKVIQRTMCPRNIVQDIPDCVACHTERK